MIAYNDVREAFHRALKSRPEIREHNIPFYHKWARDYLEWCSAARREPGEISSAGAFADLLHEAGKPEYQVRQARRAVEMLHRLPGHAVLSAKAIKHEGDAGRPQKRPVPQWHEAFQRFEQEVASRHYSRKTLKAYRHWVSRLRRFAPGKSPADLDPQDAKAFLIHLSVERAVSAATQSQAFNALLFFFLQGSGKGILQYVGYSPPRTEAQDSRGAGPRRDDSSPGAP